LLELKLIWSLRVGGELLSSESSASDSEGWGSHNNQESILYLCKTSKNYSDEKTITAAALFVAGVSFGQSKKEQIEILTNRVDSLNTVLSTTRDNASKDIGALNSTIDALNSEIAQLENDVSSLESSVSTLEKDKAKLTRENEKFKTDLEEMSKKNLELEAKLEAIEATGNRDEKSIELVDLLKWGVRRFEGVVTMASNYDDLGIIDVKLNDGTNIIIYTSPVDGLTWKDVQDRNPPGCEMYDALQFYKGDRIKGYIGMGYFGGYGHPSGIPENNIPDGNVARIIYVEKI